MAADSSTKPLERYHCVNEIEELQDLLAQNLDLLPGDQIDPGNNLRWLLVKREMPVPKPSSGEDSWALDFLMVDQDGIPTLVECKRREDTREPRTTVGQMLEYAANGRYYWTGSELKDHALNTAGGDASKLDERLRILTGSEVDAEDFFALVEANLRDSKMRLIFFLDDSAKELRSIVEFLNGQMKDTEVLIVEARQYQHGDARIVVPWVFGFSEEARVAKKESKAETGRTSVARKAQLTDEEFYNLLEKNLPGVKDRLSEFMRKLEGYKVFPAFAGDSMKLKWSDGSKDWTLGYIMTSGIFLTDTLCGQAGKLNLMDRAKEYLESIAALNPGAKVVQTTPRNWKVNIGNKTITVDVMLTDTTREDGWIHAIAEFQKTVTRSLQDDVPSTTPENSPA
jgi:hypothetical protein